MIKTFKTMLLTVFSAGLLLMPAMIPLAAHAQDIQGGVACGTEFDLNNTSCSPQDPQAEGQIEDLVKKGIDIFSVIVGIIAVVMIIVGGVKYITSGGASEKVTAAKNTILFAVIGLIIVALSQIIVRFVLSKTTS